jgi:hypothetical protein
MRIAILSIILSSICLSVYAGAQPSPLPPVGEGTGTQDTGYFNLMVNTKDYPGAGTEETEEVRFLSLVTVYGILYGVEWHKGVTDEKIQIDEKVFAIVRDMKLDDITEDDGAYRYTYSYDYIVEKQDELHVGKSIEAEGTSELPDMADAWEEARENAFRDAVKQGLDRKYTDNQQAIPPEVRGMITTYEILYDDFDYAEKVYRFTIKAWVDFEPRKTDLMPEGFNPQM